MKANISAPLKWVKDKFKKVDSDISVINSNLVNFTKVTKINESDNTDFKLVAYKCGNIVNFDIYFKKQVNLTAWTQTIYTLANKPYMELYFDDKAHPNSTCILCLRTNGVLNSNEGTIPNGAHFCGCFICQ